jgi:lysophospholipase L1-like esterase
MLSPLAEATPMRRIAPTLAAFVLACTDPAAGPAQLTLPSTADTTPTFQDAQTVQDSAPDLPSDVATAPDQQPEMGEKPALLDTPPPPDMPLDAPPDLPPDLPPDIATLDTPAPDTTNPNPLMQLKSLALVLAIGDSVGAGYNASGLNAQGGQGFARMVHTNHPAWPKCQGKDVHTLFPQAAFQSLADSGDTSADMLKVVQKALDGSLPKSVAGDVLVLVNVGGRDFNDNPTVMVSAPQTEAKAQQLRQNLAKTLTLLRDRYEVGGKKLLAVVDGIHDPTDGKGTAPKGFTKGFCKVLASPLVVPFASTIAANFAKMNAALQAEAAAQGALYVDLQAAFLGHGMNSGPERWIDDDCVHPTNPGHDLIRRKVWEQLTGKGC